MNAADSAEMLLHLAARGCAQTEDLDTADIVLLNTCTVRDHAEHRALSFLGRLAKWKAAKEGRVIIFAGCAAQRLGKSVRRKFPQADIIAGAKNIDGFAEIIDNSRLFAPAGAQSGQEQSGLIGLVNITRGCGFKCAYCIVPYVRGEAHSLPPEIIFKETRRKLDGGAAEIMLLGQVVNGYNYKGLNFSGLLKELIQLPQLKRLRWMSPHPAFIDEEFAQTIALSQKLSRHMHLPVQSGSSKVLQEMKRGYTREIFLEKIKLLDQAGVRVSTDIIVGYPTETQKDFEDTLSLLDAVPFTGAYCFKFSPRALTPAAALPPIPEEVVEKRLDILLNKVKQSSKAAYARQTGSVQPVLFETPQNGRTLTNFWVRTTRKYKIGEITDIEIKEAKETILLG
jgi:tRNA-2-methylthio-N6-dimethylallyladenosine synthase